MNRYRCNGFTLIELMLAMAFLSALLLVIAMTVIQIGNIYHRGITYKDVNQAGSSLASELQRSINMSVPFDLGTKYIEQNAAGNKYGGRLCTGQYSYIWNYGKVINGNSPGALKNIYSGSTTDEIRFVKIIDTRAEYCADPVKPIDKNTAIELLGKGQNNLAIHNFTIESPDSTYDRRTRQRIYNIGFLIGTNDATTLDGTFDVTKCKTDSDRDSNPSYCAVNQFNILARAGNDDAKQ